MTVRLADLPAITPERVLELKRDAADLKKAHGLKQSAALAQIAQREGYPSWETLVWTSGGADVVRDTRLQQKLANPTDAGHRRAMRRAHFLNRGEQ